VKHLLEKLNRPIVDDMKQFQESYKESLKSDVKLIDTVIQYISRRKGKQLRPRLSLLSARMCGNPNELTYKAASMVEILHVATLIHDDVVDDADLRRGWPSVNRIWKNKISILVGDFMFSKALANMIKLDNLKAISILSNISERLSEGEILQIEKAIKKDITEEIYFKMVSDKTACLFSAACELGALTTTTNEVHHEIMSEFGMKLGIAFQIKDDLFDIIGTVSDIGKPIGFDVKKNMLTLPMIYMLSQHKGRNKKSIQQKLKKHVKSKDVKKLREMVEESGGIEYAQKQIVWVSNEARKLLDVFPNSEYKDALNIALDFNIERVK